MKRKNILMFVFTSKQEYNHSQSDLWCILKKLHVPIAIVNISRGAWCTRHAEFKEYSHVELAYFFSCFQWEHQYLDKVLSVCLMLNATRMDDIWKIRELKNVQLWIKCSSYHCRFLPSRQIPHRPSVLSYNNNRQ